jgi:hypothetical protein
LRIPVMLNADSGDRDRGFRSSRSLIGAKRRLAVGLFDPPQWSAESSVLSSRKSIRDACGACGRAFLARPTSLWETWSSFSTARARSTGGWSWPNRGFMISVFRRVGCRGHASSVLSA